MSSSGSRNFKNAAYAHLAEVGKALSSPTRLEILDLLAQAPRTVEVLAAAIDQSVANTSHHLQALKRAQLVSTERDGLHIVYSIAGADVARLVVHLQAVAARHITSLEALRREHLDAGDLGEPVDRETLLELMRRGEILLVDVRPEQEFAAGHLRGALSIPLPELEARLAELPRHRVIVAYCRGPFCTLSAEAARLLRAHGYRAWHTDVSVHSLSLPDEASA